MYGVLLLNLLIKLNIILFSLIISLNTCNFTHVKENLIFVTFLFDSKRSIVQLYTNHNGWQFQFHVWNPVFIKGKMGFLTF